MSGMSTAARIFFENAGHKHGAGEDSAAAERAAALHRHTMAQARQASKQACMATLEQIKKASQDAEGEEEKEYWAKEREDTMAELRRL